MKTKLIKSSLIVRKFKNRMDQGKEISLTLKAGHKDSVLSSCTFKVNSGQEKLPHVFFTNSEDGTARMWDLRCGGAVKLFRSAEICRDELSNICCSFSRGQLFQASANNVSLKAFCV